MSNFTTTINRPKDIEVEVSFDNSYKRYIIYYYIDNTPYVTYWEDDDAINELCDDGQREEFKKIIEADMRDRGI